MLTAHLPLSATRSGFALHFQAGLASAVAQGSVLRRAPSRVKCSAITILRSPHNFLARARHSHLAPGLAEMELVSNEDLVAELNPGELSLQAAIKAGSRAPERHYPVGSRAAQGSVTPELGQGGPQPKSNGALIS